MFAAVVVWDTVPVEACWPVCMAAAGGLLPIAGPHAFCGMEAAASGQNFAAATTKEVAAVATTMHTHMNT